jgi:hypothetical protein
MSPEESLMRALGIVPQPYSVPAHLRLSVETLLIFGGSMNDITYPDMDGLSRSEAYAVQMDLYTKLALNPAYSLCEFFNEFSTVINDEDSVIESLIMAATRHVEHQEGHVRHFPDCPNKQSCADFLALCRTQLEIMTIFKEAFDKAKPLFTQLAVVDLIVGTDSEFGEL